VSISRLAAPILPSRGIERGELRTGTVGDESGERLVDLALNGAAAAPGRL
jgi:hypothetical protein